MKLIRRIEHRVYGLHEMNPTLVTTTHFADHTAVTEKTALHIEPDFADINKRCLELPDGNCIGMFSVDDMQAVLFI
jgi:hypothetical protein